jgi:signal transduction histidine kinase
MRSRRRYSIRYLFLAIWVVFTVSLSCWWVYFGFEQIRRLTSLGYGHENDLVRYQRMLMFEGGALLLSLVAGGLTLAYYMYREVKQGDQLKSFFLAFTHDTKTSLAAVQLQAELLRERVKTDSDEVLADRLLADVERLALQFENSLYVANLDKKQLHFEPIELRPVIASLRARFPKLEITEQGECVVRADIRALESILINLCQNSLRHGGAGRIEIESAPRDSGMTRIQITDNGKGFPGDRKRLAQRFFRHYSGSGSGLGLFLARTLARAMKGGIEFPETPRGFQAVLLLPSGDGP